MDKRMVVAKELLKMAKELVVAEEGEEEVDPKFLEKIKILRPQLMKMGRKKKKKLRQYGIGMIRPNASVEDLVDALLKVAQG